MKKSHTEGERFQMLLAINISPQICYLPIKMMKLTILIILLRTRNKITILMEKTPKRLSAKSETISANSRKIDWLRMEQYQRKIIFEMKSRINVVFKIMTTKLN